MLRQGVVQSAGRSRSFFPVSCVSGTNAVRYLSLTLMHSGGALVVRHGSGSQGTPARTSLRRGAYILALCHFALLQLSLEQVLLPLARQLRYKVALQLGVGSLR
jgi:hypothetical protein